MIGPKRPKLTGKQERWAYDVVTDERDRGRCQRCGKYGPMDRDHRQNRDAFNTTPANLQLLGGAFGCGCHIWKTQNPADALRTGFSVPRSADPAGWPARRYGVGWVLYFDEADVEGKWWERITNAHAAKLMYGTREEVDVGEERQGFICCAESSVLP